MTIQSDHDDTNGDLKTIRRSLVMLATLGFFVTAYFARDLILPIMLGFLIALTLSPIHRGIMKIGLPAAVSAFLLVALASGTIISIGSVAGGTIATLTQDAPNIGAELKRKLRGVTQTLEAVKEVSDDVDTATGASDSQAVVVKQPGLLNSAVTAAASTITSIAVAFILTFFLLASGDLFYVKLVQAFRTTSGKKRALSTVYDIEKQVSGYLLTITAINAVLGIVVGLAMWAIGMPYPLVWGVLAFALNYLPILGGIIGTILAAIYSIITFDSMSYALVAPITYQVLTSLEAQFITPVLLGKRLELNVVAVFLTVVLWGWLWGVAGALVAVPFLLVFKIICDNFESLSVIGNFLGGDRSGGENRTSIERI